MVFLHFVQPSRMTRSPWRVWSENFSGRRKNAEMPQSIGSDAAEWQPAATESRVQLQEIFRNRRLAEQHPFNIGGRVTFCAARLTPLLGDAAFWGRTNFYVRSTTNVRSTTCKYYEHHDLSRQFRKDYYFSVRQSRHVCRRPKRMDPNLADVAKQSMAPPAASQNYGEIYHLNELQLNRTSI
uniref:Uncharacterized protein n=1 Tax=Ixodes ricinus TaxID=34613 RepID=A0A6B0V0F7_IXORI